MQLNISFIKRVELFIILLLLVIVNQSLTAESYMGKYVNYDGGVRDIFVEGDNAYYASNNGGVGVIDISDPYNTIELGENDITPISYVVTGVHKDGDIIFASVRGLSAKPIFVADFDEPFDLVSTEYNNTEIYTYGNRVHYSVDDKYYTCIRSPDNGNIQGIAPDDPLHGVGGTSWLWWKRSLWDKGYESSEAINIHGNADPFWGSYAGKISFHESGQTAYIKKKIIGNPDNFIAFWISISNPVASEGDNIRFSCFNQGTSTVARLSFIHRDSSYQPQMQFVNNDKEEIILMSSDDSFIYDKWYLFKMYFKADNSNGGGEFWYKKNFADDWKSLGSNLSENTAMKSPDTIQIGVCGGSTGYISGSIKFDEIYYDVRQLENTCWKDGKISVLDANNISATPLDELFLPARCSAIVKYGDYLYVPSQRQGLVIIDASDPADIKFASTYHRFVPYDSHGVDVYQDTLYLANYSGGLFIFDVSDPYNPQHLSSVNFENIKQKLWDVVIDYPYVYGSVMCTRYDIGNDDGRGLVVYDVSNLNYIKVYHAELPNESRSEYTGADTAPLKIKKYGDYVYLSNGLIGISVYDVTDPKSPVHIGDIRNSDHVSYRGLSVDRNGRIVAGGGPNTVGATNDIYIWYSWPGKFIGTYGSVKFETVYDSFYDFDNDGDVDGKDFSSFLTGLEM